MTPVAAKPNYNLIFTIAAFVIGYMINGLTSYVSYSSKVENLTTQVTELKTTIQDLVKDRETRREKANARYSTLDNRVTTLEFKVFGRSNATIPLSINYTDEQVK